MTDYKKDFPLLAGSDIAYLDNAATAQRPVPLIYAYYLLLSDSQMTYKLI